MYAYSAAAGKTYTDLLNGTGKTISYGYGVATNKDLLTSYNGSGTLEYDNYEINLISADRNHNPESEDKESGADSVL